MSDLLSNNEDAILENSPENFSNNSGMGWLLPLLLLVLAGGLVLYFSKGCSNTAVAGMQVIDTAAENAKSKVIADTAEKKRRVITIRMINGTQIKALQDGIEKQLVLYINSKKAEDSISKNRWFDFDNLNFETGSAVITDSSMTQVKNIAAILKAYPKLKIKIGGYTDKTGDEAGNMKLSQQRAEAVLKALKTAGSNPEQLTSAEGYGSRFAKAAIDAPDEEKMKDRRISINVKEK